MRCAGKEDMGKYKSEVCSNKEIYSDVLALLFRILSDLGFGIQTTFHTSVNSLSSYIPSQFQLMLGHAVTDAWAGSKTVVL